MAGSFITPSRKCFGSGASCAAASSNPVVRSTGVPVGLSLSCTRLKSVGLMLAKRDSRLACASGLGGWSSQGSVANILAKPGATNADHWPVSGCRSGTIRACCACWGADPAAFGFMTMRFEVKADRKRRRSESRKSSACATDTGSASENHIWKPSTPDTAIAGAGRSKSSCTPTGRLCNFQYHCSDLSFGADQTECFVLWGLASGLWRR